MIGSSRITVATGFNETIAPLSTTSFVCSFNHSLVHFIRSVFWMFVGSFVFSFCTFCLFVCLLYCSFVWSFVCSLLSVPSLVLPVIEAMIAVAIVELAAKQRGECHRPTASVTQLLEYLSGEGRTGSVVPIPSQMHSPLLGWCQTQALRPTGLCGGR